MFQFPGVGKHGILVMLAKKITKPFSHPVDLFYSVSKIMITAVCVVPTYPEFTLLHCSSAFQSNPTAPKLTTKWLSQNSTLPHSISVISTQPQPLGNPNHCPNPEIEPTPHSNPNFHDNRPPPLCKGPLSIKSQSLPSPPS